MVQGGLLTAHPGGVHGYGWSPGRGSSFQQGAGAASPGSCRGYDSDNKNRGSDGAMKICTQDGDAREVYRLGLSLEITTLVLSQADWGVLTQVDCTGGDCVSSKREEGGLI